MAFDIATFDWTSLLISLVIQIVIWVIAVVPSLWIAGRLLSGKENAKFTDSLWIVIIGTVIFYFVNFAMDTFLTPLFSTSIGESFLLPLLGPLIAYLILFIVWLALVKHFFDCGWLKAFAITIIAVIIAVIMWIIIIFILGLVGITLSWLPNPLAMI